ncbi:hypothetical protein BDR22DRAFT_975663 [Usnea florida]
MAASSVPPDFLEAPSATPQINRKGWVSKDDWIKHQTLIGQLYRQQPLAEVMTFMQQEHSFRATEKMYKTRIKQWGLDKKHKENEMRAIVRKTKTLDSQGKSALFRVRGRPVDYKDVVSFFKRKNVRLEDVITQRTGSKTPEAVECFITVPSPITTPESIAIPERILVSIRDYFRGSFENGTWVTTDPGSICRTTRGQGNTRLVLDQFLNEYKTACELFGKHHFQEAGQVVNAASSRIKVIILNEHPLTLLHIFLFLPKRFREKRYEIALVILRQYSALAEIMRGKTHPIGCICRWLGSMAPSQWESVIVRCTGSMADHFESLTGPLSMSTISSRLQHIYCEDGTERDMKQGLVQVKDLLHNCESILGPQDVRSGEVRLRLAWLYYNSLDYAEAKRVGWDLITCEQHIVGPIRDFYFYSEGLYIVARSEHAMGDIHAAEIHLCEAIEGRISNYSPNDSRVTVFLVELEGWLVEQGQSSSAAEVHERWRKSLVDCADCA